jgi:PleD family two-component response regulator
MTNKVMLIDDNETNLRVMKVILEKAGFKTDTIVKPKFAFDIIKESQPCVILLDINMPEINGFQLCKLLKKDNQTAHIPIIFVSAFSDVKYIAGGLMIGGADYITKPIKPDEVVARVSVQMQIALKNKKLKKTNEKLQKQITDINMENSDIQEDLLYSLMQIKNGTESEKDYERIRNFYKYSLEKIIKQSMYSDELDEKFINYAIKKVLAE